MSRPILPHRSTPVIPDSVSTDFLRGLAPLKQLAKTSCLNELEFGSFDKFEGLFDFYMLNCMAIDGTKGDSPTPVQILVAATGLATGLLSHMESCRQEIVDDASKPSAQALLDNLSPEGAQAVRAMALVQVDSAIHTLRLVSQKLEALKTEWIGNCLVAQHAETGRIPSQSVSEESFISTRFLASIGINRADFEACMDRPIDH
jgi:hypothetical protein